MPRTFAEKTFINAKGSRRARMPAPLAEELAGDMAKVERRLQDALRSDEPMLGEIAMHIVGAGGKRLRPMAALLAYRACGGSPYADDIIELAVGLELIHSATLLHDDINDGALLRRGKEAAHRRYGLQGALVTGDFLFTKGFQRTGKFDATIVDWTAEACTKLAEGEMLQARYRRDPHIPYETYMRLVSCKTAWVIRTGCRIGAHLAGARGPVLEAMTDYGLQLGMAFQIVDDVLDVVGKAEVLGKAAGVDVREGNTTLPAMLAMRKGGPGAERLARVMQSAVKSDADVAEALALIRELGGHEAAMEVAAQHAQQARAALEHVPGGPWRDHLDGLVDLVLRRSF